MGDAFHAAAVPGPVLITGDQISINRSGDYAIDPRQTIFPATSFGRRGSEEMLLILVKIAAAMGGYHFFSSLGCGF